MATSGYEFELRADDHASCPGKGIAKRGALELPRVVAGFHVFHFAGAPGVDPFRKVREFGKMHNWRDAAQVKANVRSNGFDLFGGAHSRMLLFHGIYSE